MSDLIHYLQSVTLTWWIALIVICLSVAGCIDQLEDTFEPSEPTDCDRFALSSTLGVAGLAPSTNILLLAMHPSHSDSCCSGLLLWQDKTSIVWRVLIYRLPKSPHNGEREVQFEVVGQGMVPDSQAQNIYLKAQDAVYSAQYLQRRPQIMLDGTRYTLAIGRGDRFLFCSVNGLDDRSTRDLIESIADTGSKSIIESKAKSAEAVVRGRGVSPTKKK